MKTVRKFTTFDELKSCKKRTSGFSLNMKNHNDFEKAIKDIRSLKVHKNNQSQPKQ